MKFTMKNCPDSEWKKGFEKQLWQILNGATLANNQTVYRIMKELLGE